MLKKVLFSFVLFFVFSNIFAQKYSKRDVVHLYAGTESMAKFDDELANGRTPLNFQSYKLGLNFAIIDTKLYSLIANICYAKRKAEYNSFENLYNSAGKIIQTTEYKSNRTDDMIQIEFIPVLLKFGRKTVDPFVYIGGHSAVSLKGKTKNTANGIYAQSLGTFVPEDKANAVTLNGFKLANNAEIGGMLGIGMFIKKRAIDFRFSFGVTDFYKSDFVIDNSIKTIKVPYNSISINLGL